MTPHNSSLPTRRKPSGRHTALSGLALALATLTGCGHMSMQDVFITYTLIVGLVVIAALGVVNLISWALISMDGQSSRVPKWLQAAGRVGRVVWALVSAALAACGLYLMLGLIVTPDMFAELTFTAGVAISGLIHLACLALEATLLGTGVWLVVQAIKGPPPSPPGDASEAAPSA